MSNVESQSTDSRQEALMTNEISKDLENNLNNANPKEVAEILDKTVTLPDHDPVTMNIEKKKTGEMEILGPEISIIETNKYTKPLLNIKNLESGDSDIPKENREAIINAINNLGEFQKIKIVGCTDASKINTPTAIEKNKLQFNEVREKYLAAGGICPTYEELLKSPEDPQNTVLGYARAMQGILSLNLTPDQMKKVEIGNKLGTKENFGQERGFDIETNYTEEINRTIQGLTHENIYRMFGELNKKHIERDGSHHYAIDQLQISTSGNFEKLYQDIFKGTKNFVGENNPALEDKIRQQTADFLNHLIHVCGGAYSNGVWSSNSISDKMYYLIVASDPDKGFLSQQDFFDVVENNNLFVLGNQPLSTGGTVDDFIQQNQVTGVYKTYGPKYRYTTTDKEKMNNPLAREITNKGDFIKLALYFTIKNEKK